MRIIAYEIISASNTDAFQKVIDDYLAEGWHPYGNPFSDRSCIWQAMVKYQSKEDAFKEHFTGKDKE